MFVISTVTFVAFGSTISILEPLIIQRGDTGRRDTKGCGVANIHRHISWLRGDFWTRIFKFEKLGYFIQKIKARL